MNLEINNAYLIDTKQKYNAEHLHGLIFIYLGLVSVYSHNDYIYGKLSDGRPIQFLVDNKFEFTKLPKTCCYLYS